MWNWIQKALGWAGDKAPAVFGSHLDRQLKAQWEADRALFEKLRSELPTTGSIDFVRHHPPATPFQRDEPDQLFKFMHHWNDPEHEFLDAELDRKRATLFAAASAYLDVLATQTWSMRDTDLQGVPEEWEYNNPERLAQVIEDLRKLGKSVVEAHDDMIRTGRRKLKC